ncbi:hypothetical protein C8R41DRAFT_869594 [Lentinula lateritia]|uniref:Uncharacterized protein n=1 Tax=Lentinula lateritia TaxID=40482 RepID=A0ABQ8V7R6_9AGAR|nr:hypothetical protein C8R41DRAFT_869594 [Lentinula lateritia]
MENSPPEELGALTLLHKACITVTEAFLRKYSSSPLKAITSNHATRVTVPEVTEYLSAEDEWDSSEVINNTAVAPLVPGGQEYKREELSSSHVGAAVSPVTRSEPKDV